MCSLCRLPVAKNRNFGQILTFLGTTVGGLLYRPLLPIRVKVCVESTPKVYTYTPNFMWMCSLYRLLVAKNHNFGQILTFWGLLYRPLLPMRAKFTALQQTHGIRLLAKFRLDRFILSPLTAKNSNFCAFFGQRSERWSPQNVAFCGLRHFVVSPVGSNLRILNTGAQPKTFPYPMASKSFLYSNAFMTKSGHKFWHSRAWRTNRQTNNKQTKNSTFLIAPDGGWNPNPTKLGIVIEDLEHVLPPLKLLGVRRIISPLGALKIWGNPTLST